MPNGFPLFCLYHATTACRSTCTGRQRFVPSDEGNDGNHHERNIAAPAHAHQVQHFVMKNLAIRNGSRSAC